MREPTYKGVAYGPEPHQWLDIYLPRGSQHGSPVAAMLWLHGGGDAGSQLAPGSNTDPPFAQWSDSEQEGVAWVYVEYAVPPLIFPRPQQDVALAVSFLRSNASDYGLDDRRLVPVGRSFGALLAGCVAYSADYLGEPPPAVALMQGMLDWTELVPSFPAYHFGQAQLGDVDGDRLADASPLQIIGDPPFAHSEARDVPAWCWYGNASMSQPPFSGPHESWFGQKLLRLLRAHNPDTPTVVEVGTFDSQDLLRWVLRTTR